jgi:hypothetical protein
MQNPIPLGIEPAIFRLVAQFFNQLRTAYPQVPLQLINPHAHNRSKDLTAVAADFLLPYHVNALYNAMCNT